jgi:hypothetical protein
MRYIDADKLIEHINNMPWKMDSASEITKFIFLSTVEEAPTADVVPKKEIANVLCDLKHKIHDKAVRPNNAGIDAYVSLKTFDAVLQGMINKYEQKNDGGAKYEKTYT